MPDIKSPNGKPLAKASELERKKRPVETAYDDDDDDVPLKKRRKSQPLNGTKKAAQPDSDDDDDKPLVKRERTSLPAAPSKKIKKEYSSSDDDKPLIRTKKVAKPAKAATPRKKAAVKTEVSTPASADAGEEEGDEEQVQQWWHDMEAGQNDTGEKWTTLSHQGVVFPPEYEVLPANVSLLYNGVPVKMQPTAEEIAHGFGSMLNSEHNVTNPVFIANFFKDFSAELERTGGAKDAQGQKVKIAKFELLDFTKIFDYVTAQRDAKKALSSAEKKQLKEEKDKLEAPYKICIFNGKEQQVANFRVEPPGLFRGRGAHPKTGRWKKRVSPEEVTINIGKDAVVPAPPPGHKWKAIVHNQAASWLAMWQETLNGNYKYVFLGAASDIKGQSDYKKFEKARKLKHHIAAIRKDYTLKLKSELMVDRQMATAMYLIDQFSFRAGNEKGEDEADTVGCCSLKMENVILRENNKVFFSFLGKDSILFESEFTVEPQVFKNLKIFKRAPKKDGDEIFDRITTTSLNKQLSTYMEGLTAKVLRTHNASSMMSKVLQDMDINGTIQDKVTKYNDANREVAILCNHKRTVTASHAQQMEKMGEKIDTLRFEQWRLKQQMLDLEPTLKKKKGASYFQLPEDFEGDWVAEHHKALVEAEKLKITKKFTKENEKLASEGSKPQKQSVLEERLEIATELAAKLKKERKTGKVAPEGKGPTVEKLEEKINKLQDRIKTQTAQSEIRENNKEVALGTSKINYIDPRITVAFCKKFDVPIERFFSKVLREKFTWAIESADETWEF